MSSTNLHLKPSEILSSPRVKPAPKSTGISVPFAYNPSDDGTDENLLILLHGLGDTHEHFGKLGRQLRLPQTATLAIRAPQSVPYLYEDAFQWYPSFDHLGNVLINPNPTSAIEFINKVLSYLTAECKWTLSRIHLFGFGQGGSVAIEITLSLWKASLREAKRLVTPDTSAESGSGNETTPSPLPESLASIVTVSGPTLLHHVLSSQCPTPVLVFHRSSPSESYLKPGDILTMKKYFSSVRELKLGGDGMPRSRDEWHPIMEFWSQRLSRRQADGVYEVLGGMVPP